MPRISVLILTLNEERNLADCLEACSWCDDIVVFDSFSTDRTLEIAAQKGARCYQRSFDNYAAQRNAALHDIPYKHPWVLMLDADERTPTDLIQEMDRRIKEAGDDIDLFRMRRKDFFLGRWLRRSSGYPTWFGRLIRLGHVRVEREVNEEYITDGQVAYLECHLLHYPFNNGIDYWFARHNRYSGMEALGKIRDAGTRRPIALRHLFTGDPIERRRALKGLAYRMPMRPTLVFVYWYLCRFGVLDGSAGLRFCLMRASYEFLIDLKVLEAQRRARGEPV